MATHLALAVISALTLITKATTTTRTPDNTASGTATLVSGYSWIRAVESPYSHSYLQPGPTATPSSGFSDAYLGPASMAGQFRVADGQVQYYTGNVSGQVLYLGVEDANNKSQRALETWFDATANIYGTFSLAGDTLTWTADDLTRPNPAAWYVCGGEGQLYINTGDYGYNAPSGCVDETIHVYGGSTANI
ncbi:hypothetical protein GQ53DRAFT_778961 [Thozetella sp. PMI_491]|nr:hypothetical protein GQ53DRAFT_778961 [Thozetella sp. PMI_491]